VKLLDGQVIVAQHTVIERQTSIKVTETRMKLDGAQVRFDSPLLVLADFQGVSQGTMGFYATLIQFQGFECLIVGLIPLAQVRVDF